MKKFLPVLAMIALFTATHVGSALAEEKKIVGPVTKIQLGVPNGASATVTVKDGKTGKQETIVVTDEATLDKLKSKKINVDDEVRAKFDTANGAAKSMKRTAGCD
jgi:superfamily I DNA and RNA helicase